MGLMNFWTEAFPSRRKSCSARDISFRGDDEAVPESASSIAADSGSQGNEAEEVLETERPEIEAILAEEWAFLGSEASETLKCRCPAPQFDAASLEVVLIVKDFCMNPSPLRVKPTEDDLQALWSRLGGLADESTSTSTAITRALTDQILSELSGHEWKPQLRALCVVQFLFCKGEMERSIADAVVADVSELLRHLSSEVPACQEAALRVIELHKLAKVMPLGESTEIGIADDGEMFILKVPRSVSKAAAPRELEMLQEDEQETREGTWTEADSGDEQKAGGTSCSTTGLSPKSQLSHADIDDHGVDDGIDDTEAECGSEPPGTAGIDSSVSTQVNTPYFQVSDDCDCDVSDGDVSSPRPRGLAAKYVCGLRGRASKSTSPFADSTLDATVIDEWESVVPWLEDLAIGRYATALADAGYDDLRILRDMEDDEVQDVINLLAMPLGHARQLKRGLVRLRDIMDIEPCGLQDMLPMIPARSSSSTCIQSPRSEDSIDVDEVGMDVSSEPETRLSPQLRRQSCPRFAESGPELQVGSSNRTVESCVVLVQMQPEPQCSSAVCMPVSPSSSPGRDFSADRYIDEDCHSEWIHSMTDAFADDDAPIQKRQTLLRISEKSQTPDKARRQVPFIPWGVELTIPEIPDPFAHFADDVLQGL